MTVRELVIPFQRNKRSKSVTTAGRPAGRPLILTFLRYIEVDSLRASRSARNKSVETHVMFPHSVRLEFCCICLFSDGHCSCMCSDSNTANLRLSLHIVIIVVLAVRCCRVSGMLCCSCMCSFGAPSLKCMVSRLESEVVVTPM